MNVYSQYSMIRATVCDNTECTLCPSKFDTLLSNVIALSNIGRFSNYFQHFNRHEICDKSEISHRP